MASATDTAVTNSVAQSWRRRCRKHLHLKQRKRDRRGERGRYDEAACEFHHGQRPHSMPVGSLPSSTGGVTVGVASAYCVTVQSPAAAAQFAAKVQGELLVF